jgi:thiamine biosynthesis lipoprotein
MSGLLIHVSRRAMACEFEVCFSAERHPQGTEWALAALDRVEQLEEELSYFRSTSEVSRVNLLAGEGPVEVSPGLFGLLGLAVDLNRQTHGAYDVTSAPLWEAWGFARRRGEIPSDRQLAEAWSKVGSDLLELDATRRTVRFRRHGMKINLGSIGKGHALDVCGQHLATAGMADFLLHGGQSSILGRGTESVPETALDSRQQQAATTRVLPPRTISNEELPAGRAWEIGIQHPGRLGRRIGVARLRDQALGTSGGQFQSFRHEGRRYGHILDPRSGLPAEGVLSSTVLAPTAALADALSTAFYVLGPDATRDYCQAHAEIGAILICPFPPGDEIQVHTIGLPEDVFSPA